MNELDPVLVTVIDALPYYFIKDILVKPLKPTMVTKTFTEQVPNGGTDEEGYNLYDTKTEEREVESDWAEGVVLALPAGDWDLKYGIGDTVVYNKRFAQDFDLFKDSKLVKTYDVVGVKTHK